MIAATHHLALAAAQRPIDVHVDTGSWLSDYLALFPPVAILIGVYLAYVFATKNVQREMTAADARQGEQLRHDRIMRATDAARSSVDDAAEVLTKAMSSLSDYSAKLVATEQRFRIAEAAPTGSEEKPVYSQKWADMVGETSAQLGTTTTQTNQLYPALLRLRLRFPEDDPVYRAYREAVGAIEAAFDAERQKGVAETRKPQELDEANTLRLAIPEKVNQFVAAARAWHLAALHPD